MNNKNKIADRFIKNVKFLCEYEDRRITAIEKFIQRAPGYLSRPTSTISLDDAYKISWWLGRTLDELIEEDLVKRIKREAIAEQIAQLENELEEYK